MADLSKHISQLREDFMKGSLHESEIHKNPFLQFDHWLKQAIDAKVPEPNAMHLATVSKEGKPSGRIVYLREFKDNKFWFYTNYNSKKSEELSANPFASLTFYWPELERQIRIEGPVEKASEDYSNAYYNARPYDSKIGAWASPQSKTLKSREELETKIETLKKTNTPESIKRPDFWGGFVLKAEYYEFWQGRKNRLHDRLCFRSENNSWDLFRIAP